MEMKKKKPRTEDQNSTKERKQELSNSELSLIENLTHSQNIEDTIEKVIRTASLENLNVITTRENKEHEDSCGCHKCFIKEAKTIHETKRDKKSIDSLIENFINYRKVDNNYEHESLKCLCTEHLKIKNQENKKQISEYIQKMNNLTDQPRRQNRISFRIPKLNRTEHEHMTKNIKFKNSNEHKRP